MTIVAAGVAVVAAAVFHVDMSDAVFDDGTAAVAHVYGLHDGAWVRAGAGAGVTAVAMAGGGVVGVVGAGGKAAGTGGGKS